MVSLRAPFARLDADELQGYGPETITISRLERGVYRYAVHRFSGTRGIAASGARVDVYVGGVMPLAVARTSPMCGVVAGIRIVIWSDNRV